MLTPEMAKEAYQSAIPERREKFEHSAQKCLAEAAHKDFIQQYYTTEIMRLAKAELRTRLEMAATRVKQMIDSAWTPTTMDSVRSVYGNMFAQFNHWNRNTFDDLTSKVSGAFGTIGLPSAKQQHNIYCLEFSQYQVDVSTEFTHDLEFYMAAKQPDNPNSTTVRVEGNVNFLQTGGTSTVTQYIGSDLLQATDMLKQLRSAVAASDEKRAAAIDELVDKAIEVAGKDSATWPMVARALDGCRI